jgi:hypothetical protein
MAVAEGAALVARIEVRVSHFQRSERDATYAAQAMLAAAAQDLERQASWSAVLSGAVTAAFVDGPPGLARQIPGGRTVSVCCAAGSMSARLRAETGQAWQLFAWQSLRALLQIPDAPRYYVVAWVLDDPEESDGDPLTDSNDRIALRIESVDGSGVRKAIETLVARAPLDVTAGTRLPGLELLVWRMPR